MHDRPAMHGGEGVWLYETHLAHVGCDAFFTACFEGSRWDAQIFCCMYDVATYISCIVTHLGIPLEKWQCTLYIRSRYWRTRETQTRRQQSTNCLLPLLLLVGNEHISLGEAIQPEISQSYGHFPYPLSSPGICRRLGGCLSLSWLFRANFLCFP